MNLEDGNILIFKNKNRKEEKHPALVGHACIDGVQREIAMWPKHSEKAGNYYSGRIRVAEDKPESKPAPKPESKPDFDDDIPF